ncbi:MAG: hypothetical protein ACKVUS_00560 [Saprospiraceae bacterium]
MKKHFAFTLVLALGLFVYLPSIAAQGTQCKGCAHATPTEIHSSTKNALTISGPPDGKGKPVEYQIFTQSKDGAWKLETSGKVEKPGARETFKYYRPVQLMVLIYCETPFGRMVEFSNVRMAPPPPKD